ncbi:dual specificity protein phosphatase Mpk3 [Ischnura elegans]|uniref:dual specificity protein phosphatase Mpk3 n=1 Tax=Ischnura elegans TaxID=197161 RepID=UPI001ED87461|nr:dual specificity protein phosphatase Mpk3 [Ischnura elegans]
MPSEDSRDRIMSADGKELSVSAEWLLQELRSNSTSAGLVILDCRSSNEYVESHIRHAVNFSIPTIMLRRLAAGKIDLLATIKCRELKSKIMTAYKENVFVVYGDIEQSSSMNPDTLQILSKRLQQDGCHVVYLEGGFSSFRNLYPEWCETDSLDAVPLVGLRSLRIAGSSTVSTNEPPRLHWSQASSAPPGSVLPSAQHECSDEDCCSSASSADGGGDFPVEILPHLFLGNAANSEDGEALSRHRIQYILNVTPNLPNVFEDSGAIKYMQIPITDHWSQNLARFFPNAIQFIDEARSRGHGVLVHCVAGVSRSVTVTLAYLMHKLSLRLDDAFNLVRSRKADVAPNFHFMQQLLAFEREVLGEAASGHSDPGGDALPSSATSPPLVPPSSSSSLDSGRGSPPGSGEIEGAPPPPPAPTPTNLLLDPRPPTGTSPDSGIEFDRWATSVGE